MMAFVTLEDLYGTIEVIVFPKTYNSYQELLYEDNIVLLEGTLNVSEEETPKLICNRMSQLTNKESQKLYIKVMFFKNMDLSRNMKSL